MKSIDTWKANFSTTLRRIIRAYRISLSFIGIGFLLLIYDRGCQFSLTPDTTGQQAYIFQHDDTTLDYLLHLPSNYDERRSWPVILYLHGASLRGSNVEKVKQYGLAAKAAREPNFPFMLISPQCPSEKGWHDIDDAVLALLDDVINRYAADDRRVYLTGVSLGGSGAWHLAAKAPDRFAALAPLCGYGNPQKADVYRDLPVWIFHGAKDKLVPVRFSDDMYAALRKTGATVKFSRFKNAGHNIVEQVYQDPDLYDWFRKQRTGSFFPP